MGRFCLQAVEKNQHTELDTVTAINVQISILLFLIVLFIIILLFLIMLFIIGALWSRSLAFVDC